MNWFNTIAIVVVVYLAVFLQATSNELRHWLGVQIDLLPSLVVYASLSRGIATMSCVAVCGNGFCENGEDHASCPADCR